MRGFKLLLCSLFVGLFGILSFSSASDSCRSTLTHTGEINIYGSNGYINAFNYGDRGSGTFCFRLNPKSGSIQAQVKFGFANSPTATPSNLYTYYADQYSKFVCLYGNKPYFNISATTSCQSSSTCKFPFQWFAFELDNKDGTYDYYLNCVENALNNPDCSSDSNYLQCLEDKNLLIGEVSTLSGSLTTCQSDLSSCRGGQDASLLACIDQKEQCETNLSTLSGNYESLSNMNSSLSEQLQECLQENNLTGDLLCNKFDLIWSSENTNYSFPINNDLFLPSGYKGFVNEGVLAIKQDSSLTSAYSISDEDFQEVMDSYGVVLLYLFGSALFLVFLYTIRKYFIGLKS